MMKENSGPCSLVLERPFFPFPIHQLYLMNDIDILYNRGRVPVATWNKNLLASNLRTSCEGSGNSGFIVFSPKLLTLNGWNVLSDGDQIRQQGKLNGTPSLPFSPIINIFSEKDIGDSEWAHGNFPLEEYVMALDRSKGELYYNHDLGMRYSKVWHPDFSLQNLSFIQMINIQLLEINWTAPGILLFSILLNTIFIHCCSTFYFQEDTFPLPGSEVHCLRPLLDYRANIRGIVHTNGIWCGNAVRCCGEVMLLWVEHNIVFLFYFMKYTVQMWRLFALSISWSVYNWYTENHVLYISVFSSPYRILVCTLSDRTESIMTIFNQPLIAGQRNKWVYT